MPNNLASIAGLEYTRRGPEKVSIIKAVLPCRAQLTNSYAKIFTNDTAGKCVIDAVKVCNRSGASTTVSLAIVSPAQGAPWSTAADAIADYVDVPVDTKESITLQANTEPTYLDPGDEIWMKAGAVTSLTVNLSISVEQ